MFALGISRDQSTQTIFTTAIALALAAVPMAMPTVLQVILSKGSTTLAAEGAVVKSLASVETLGSTSAINSDKTGTLTLNQVTVVEVIDPTDRYEITGMGYGLDGDVKHAAGNTNTIEQAILPFLIANDAKLVDGKVVGDPTEGALLVLGHKAKLDVDGTQAGLSEAGDASVRPHLQTDGGLCRCHGRIRKRRRASVRQGCRPGRDRAGGIRPRQRQERALGRRAERTIHPRRWSASAGRGCGSWSPPPGISTRRSSTQTETCFR